MFVVLLATPENPGWWEQLGEVKVPARTQMSTVEKKLLDGGHAGYPEVPIGAGQVGFLQLVRKDAIGDAIPVLGRAAVLLDVLSPEALAELEKAASEHRANVEREFMANAIGGDAASALSPEKALEILGEPEADAAARAEAALEQGVDETLEGRKG